MAAIRQASYAAMRAGDYDLPVLGNQKATPFGHFHPGAVPSGGSTIDLAQELIGRSVIPREFMLSLSASAVVIDIAEPGAMLIFAPALLGLVALRWRTAHRVGTLI